MKPKPDKALIISLILALAYLIIGFNYNINLYDEGVGLLGAERLASGELPYKDFWTIYTPGNYYFQVIIFDMFGWNLLVSRFISIFIYLGCAITAFQLTKKITNNNYALIPFWGIILWHGEFPLNARPLLPALLISLLSILILFKYLDGKKLVWLFLAGILTGTTIFFKQDTGGYILAGILLFLFIKEKPAGNSNIKKVFIECLLVLSGVFILLLPWVLYFLSNVNFHVLWEQLVTIPLFVFPKSRLVPFPNPVNIFSEIINHASFLRILNSIWMSLAFYTPFIILLICIYIALRNKLDKQVKEKVLLLILTGLFFSFHIMVRPDMEHLTPLIFISLLLLPIIFVNFKTNKLVIAGLIMLIALIVGHPVLKKFQDVNNLLSGNSINMTGIPRAAAIYGSRGWFDDYYSTIKYVRSNVPPGEKFFSGCINHQQIVFNDVTLYFLTERKPATRYHELHPGIATTASVQSEIIEELIKNRVKLIVLIDYKSSYKPFDNSNSEKSDLLDDFIRKNFNTVKIFGMYHILKKVE